MIGRETRMLLRHYLAQGASKSELARQLGISRDTIHRWIRSGDLDRDLETTAVRYGPRRPVPTKLDAYKAILETRLAAYPALSAVRLLAEIRAAGYDGSYTQLKAFVRQVRPTPPPEPVIRFETPAGRQAQVDFARFSFAWGVRYALLVVLGYSRVLWCRFYPRQDMRTLIEGLEEAFRSFGGVPQELLFDQMKAVITRDLRLQGGALVRNLEFLRFAHHWSFTPRACRPYRAQTKGKVERPVRPASHAGGLTPARRARSPRCDPPGRRWRHADRTRGDRAAPRRADPASQRPPPSSRDALQPAPGDQTAHRV